MKVFSALFLAAVSLALAAPANAALAVGEYAPDFTTRGAQGGALVSVSLSDLLGQGPVVLYFFPQVFTGGCTAQAHEFAEAIDQFRAAGAIVLGMSADPPEALAAFSAQECAGKFRMASAGPRIVSSYDVGAGDSYTDRVSYVIERTGRIAYVHADPNYVDHVKNTLAAVRSLKR